MRVFFADEDVGLYRFRLTFFPGMDEPVCGGTYAGLEEGLATHSEEGGSSVTEWKLQSSGLNSGDSVEIEAASAGGFDPDTDYIPAIRYLPADTDLFSFAFAV